MNEPITIEERYVLAKIKYDMMMESDLKGELTDEEYDELAILKATLLQLRKELGIKEYNGK
jgi:hypothetical protein